MSDLRATSSGWQIPKALPDLRRVGIVALDTETNDEGLRADRGAAWPWRGADETLRQALVEPIIRNIAAGSIATVVHHRRGAE